MWFKNAFVYKLSRDVFEVEDLQALFEDFKYTPCSKSTAKSFGWVSPIPETTNLIHYAENNLYLTAKLEEKILPTCVINEALKEAVAEKELKEERALKKEEKSVLKSALYQKLLAQAFSKKTIFKMVVLRTYGLIVIDTASDKKAEDLLSLLRKTLGSLPAIPLVANKPLPTVLTSWVREQVLPAGFALGEEAELDSINEGGGIIRCKEQDLSA
ncbi:recombination-associated protein RdgC, partial [Photobacterium damselae]|uniref:recombination-associated protein RdgC n=2 Tax=Photobacterium damselae TaxID=38293 RepID=UPI004067E64D